MSQSLTVHEHNYYSTKQEFPALKWAIAEQFQEYLLCKWFIIKTDNNPLLYIMTAPQFRPYVTLLGRITTGFTFSIEYQKGWDNAGTDALNQITSKLDTETVKSILDRVTVGLTGRADAHNPVVAVTNEEIHKQVLDTAVQSKAATMHVNLHVTDWVAAKGEDPILKTMIEWISNWKVQHLKHLLGNKTNTEEGMAVL